MLALEDMDRRQERKDRARGRLPAPSGPPIALGDRTASSRGGARRPETLEEKRARHEAAIRRTAADRSKADWENMRRTAANTTAAHARRVREQQFISALQG